MTNLARLAALVSCAVSIGAVQTKTWSQRDQADFEKATLKGVALRSDGRMTLAPAVKELFDVGTQYLWAIARDSKGNLYAAGGGQGSSTVHIYRVDASGKGSRFAEIEGLEIHGLAVDKQDRLYTATSPDGKIWRIGADGKASVFYDPKVKYVWAIAFSTAGDLYVATGDPGEVHRVAADGKGSTVYRLEDAHARSMTLDERGNVILGTEPSGLIVRVTPAGEGFILHQSSKREVTAVVATGGRIYAAAVGSKTATPPVPALPPPPPATANPAVVMNPMAPRATAPAIPPASGTGATVSGGSELIEIAPDGAPRTIWSHPQDIVYSLALNEAGQPVLGTGNKGSVYRVDSPVLFSLLFSTASTQVTALVAGPNTLFAAGANVGKIFQIGPGFETRGTVESDVFDSGLFSRWGRLHGDVAANGGTVAFETRSGNLDRPQKSWSAWAPLKEGRIVSPPARFLQWRATLVAAPGAGSGSAPELFGADVAWLAKNVVPRVDEVEATEANYRFPQPSGSTPPTNTLTLPPLGRKQRPAPPPVPDGSSPAVTLNYAKGSAGVRWAASDANGDALIFKVEIRGVNETAWKLLKENVRERYLTYDSTAFPDGDYMIRVTASDAPDNAPADALTAELISPSFLIDNTAPKIENLSAQPAGGRVQIRFRAADESSWISKAEYSVNGVEWLVIDPESKLSDSKALDYSLLLDRPQPGELTIAVRVTDEFDNQALSKIVVK